jgi:hypothetical protein
MLGFGEKPARFLKFRDGMGNFELFYPKGWKYDEDIAVVDGKYTISFQSRDGLEQFTVSVDVQLPERFRFDRYAKAELESPTSGIYTPVKKTRFRDMPAYARGYSYTSDGRRYFGGGVMFFTGQAVFSVSWGAPESRKETLDAVFGHMLKTLSVREGPVMARRKRTVQYKTLEMAAMEQVKET